MTSGQHAKLLVANCVVAALLFVAGVVWDGVVISFYCTLCVGWSAMLVPSVVERRN